MKLRLKLPAAFALALGFLFAGGMFGLYQLNRAVVSFEDDVLQQVAGHKKGAEISANFSTAIQEWKNVLLRGKDPKELDKYWGAHVKRMDEVNAGIKELDLLVADASEEQALVSKLAAEMIKAQEGYKQALDAFKAADTDFVAGDKAAKGKDRGAADTLEQLRAALSKKELASTEAAKQQAKAATQISLIVMVLVTIASLAGAVWLSRQIVQPLEDAAVFADRVAHGDLTHAIHAGGAAVGANQRSDARWLDAAEPIAGAKGPGQYGV